MTRTMRRSVLILAAISFSAWSQPAQQQAQPPIVVQVQMPPESILTAMLKIAIPTVLGAGLALFGVWLTNRHNEKTNAANRQHQLEVEIKKAEIAAEAKSRDNRWAFRKDVYVNLITATSGLIRVSAGVANDARLANQLKQEGTPATDTRITSLIQRMNSFINEQTAHGNTFATYVSLSPLAIAEDVVPFAKTTWAGFNDLDLSTPELLAANMPKKQEALGELLRKLQSAGRKDLWGTSEPDGKAEAAT